MVIYNKLGKRTMPVLVSGLVPIETAIEIRALSDKNDKTISSIVRDACEMWLEVYKEHK